MYVISMSSFIIRQFNPSQASELAKRQTQIYNQAITDFPDYLPVSAEEIFNRFQQKEFDPKRMFYAYDGPKMVGFATLSARDIKHNLRTMSYPWILKDTSPSVRDLLYTAIERQCRHDGTKILRTFVFESYPDIFDFFISKKFTISQEFIIMEKELTKNAFRIPLGYKIRSLQKGDLPKLESIALHDKKLKVRFTPSDWNQFLNLSEFNPADVIVAEKDGTVVGFYALSIPSDSSKTKAYIAGEAINVQDQVIEPFLVMGLENRALEHGKKTLETFFKSGSSRIRLATERGFQKIGINFRLDKVLL